ncbi:hypothetical protein UFOVP328_218 [uncultured Caudovirales phage]|uniref:Uncharacterized protein n=1 Tax=uncultured Caudovirales phage TaxID=2100421 RepID=A0A6J5LU88_9CAUD|nr:hypothetical protein UFOVP328_218 [uncultured Caudovirales phage]
MPITHERGYLIPAIDTETVDYVQCAERLKDSILSWHPDANITIVTKDMLPYGDQGGYANDWQMFYISPYRETIKLEADMIAASPVDHWWTMFEHRDLVISQGCRDFYNRTSNERFYRKIFDDNDFPDVYNAITYWRLSKTAQEFFQLVRQIFEHWENYRTLLKFPDDIASTDVVYAMAAVVMGVENCTLPPNCAPQIVHMKRKIIGTQTENWTQELVWELQNPGLRIQTVAQQGMVHYHIKDWL